MASENYIIASYSRKSTQMAKYTHKIASLLVILLVFPLLTLAQATPVKESQQFDELKRNLNQAKSSLSKSMVNSSMIERRLSEVSKDVQSLDDQIKQLDKDRLETENRISEIGKELESNQKKSKELEQLIDDLQKEISTQESNLSQLLRIIYIESIEAGFFDPGDLQTVKLLLNDESVNQILERADSLNILEYSLSDLVKELRANKEELLNKKAELDEIIQSQKDLLDDLKNEKILMSLQIESKKKLLESTKGEEATYQKLLQAAKKEQIQIRSDIVELTVDYNEVKKQLGIDGFADEDLGSSDKLSFPVPPSMGISAYFRDPTYKAAMGVNHNAVDIRASMGTAISAPADGVVLKVKGGEGNDYHYVIIAHNDNIMTLYGHMYDIYVLPGDKLKKGDVIGLSGGMPGSRGAGWLTTGPHLHFEVFLNGKNVDPMDYLDLSELPKKYWPK